MRCSACSTENPPEAKFCLECATPLARRCSHCGTQLPAAAKFCVECARPVVGIAASRPSTPEAAPRSYTPAHLAEKILTSAASLEGERKLVTVLFADLKGSMELLADRDPEQARTLLDPVLERMMEAVHRYEGTVNQVMGDGIMALFGAPLAHEDHAVRACYAALLMQELVTRYAGEARRTHGVNVQIRVGLNSGEVVVRAIGSDLHMDYSAVGQTTHLAARMEQLASPGSILLTPSTLDLAEGYVAVKPLGPVPVKGLADPLEVYEVTGPGPARTRLQASARRGLTRFVGREAELEQLRLAQQRAGSGRGQVVALVGEAGVGKSRLVYEFTHSHRLQGWLTLENASVSYGRATSYLPVIDLLKSYFTIQERDEPRGIREKVTGKLLALDRALESTLPPLLALLDVPVADALWSDLNPGQRRQQTLDAVRQLLLREAREQPLLLIFEDLHWIDGETQALLDSLVESLGSARLLLLVNYRPEYRHAWGGKTYYSQLRLDALPTESAWELLEALLGDDAGLAPLKQLLVRRGNPFFLEETVRTLVETQALAGEPGGYRLTQPIQAIRVPPTVQVMLAARIDRLDPEDKRLLQTASVVGKDVPFALLEAIADLPDEVLRRGLDRLQAAEFLYETGLYPDLEYTFKHALTHEVTYGSLLQERRRELHARIVEAIEDLYRDRLAEHVERLAHHAVRGEVWDRALSYLRQAGEKATWRMAHREAIGHFEQALAAIGHLPERRELLEQAVDLRFDLRASLGVVGELDRVRDVLREAERLAETLGDRRRVALASAYLAENLWATVDIRKGAEIGQRAAAMADDLDDFGLRVVASQIAGHAYMDLAEYLTAEALLKPVVDALHAEPAGERYGQAILPAVSTCYSLVLSLGFRGEFPEAVAYGEAALRIAEAAEHPASIASALAALGLALTLQGEAARAVVVLERSITISRANHLGRWSHTAFLGFSYLLAGRVAEGIATLEEGLALAAAAGRIPCVSLWSGWLAGAYLQAGRAEDARRTAIGALELARKRAERGYEAMAMRELGAIEEECEPRDLAVAESWYHQALARAEALGMRPLIAHCRLGLGKLYRRAARDDEAVAGLSTATEMFRSMEMTCWLSQADAELAELIALAAAKPAG